MTLQKVIHEGNVSEYQSSDCEPLSKTDKSEDTWYQNTSGGALVVMLSFEAENDRIFAGIHVNSTKNYRRIMGTGESSIENITFIVPNGHYYNVTNNMLDEYADQFGINEWVETSLI